MWGYIQQTVGGVVGMASRSFIKDSTVPAVTILQPAANASVNGAASVAGACESGLQVAISGAGLSATASTTCASGMYSANASFTSGDTSKTFTVSQTDAAGNVGSVSRTVIRDSAPPLLTIAAPSSGAQVRSSITVSGACESGPSVTLGGAGLAQSVSAPCSSGMYTRSVNLSSGEGSKTIPQILDSLKLPRRSLLPQNATAAS
jgi:hypothetical protein